MVTPSPPAGAETLAPAGASIEIDCVILKGSYCAASVAATSPPTAVADMALSKVRQGSANVQGLLSEPAPETKLRGCWASPADVARIVKRTQPVILRVLFIVSPLLLLAFSPSV